VTSGTRSARTLSIRWARRIFGFAIGGAIVGFGSGAAAQPFPSTNESWKNDLGTSEAPAPPPLHVPYLQYGVALTAEFVAAAGKICAVVTDPPTCILGSGGGVAVRVGKRTAGPWYFGAAYELSKHDASKIYRLAILQQVRAETRYYVDTGRDVEPFALGGIGAIGYGNEWGIDTFGPMAFLGAGLEAQITRRTVVGVALTYRSLYFTAFSDTSGSHRDNGIASIFGLDILLEQRDPL